MVILERVSYVISESSTWEKNRFYCVCMLHEHLYIWHAYIHVYYMFINSIDVYYIFVHLYIKCM